MPSVKAGDYDKKNNAGKKAIEVYKKTYNINGCALNMCKDISDAVKQHGFKTVHKNLKPLLKETIHKKNG